MILTRKSNGRFVPIKANLDKYPKPERLPVGLKVPGKKYMNNEDMDYLFNARLLVQEKMDGKATRFESDDFIVFSEDMRTMHSIRYRVPARYCVYDVLDRKRGYFLNYTELYDLTRDMQHNPKLFAGTKLASFFLVPALSVGWHKLEDLPQFIGESRYPAEHGTLMEGIVVKPNTYMYPAGFMAGKIVRSEFTEGIILHHMRRQAKYNIIDPSTPIAEVPTGVLKTFAYRQLKDGQEPMVH